MWFLQNNEGHVIYIKVDRPNIVGRNNGDIVLKADKSISRKHATISVNENEMFIEDHKATYGTYVNEGISQQKRIDPETIVSVCANDKVRFGMLGNEWTILKFDFITCLSTVREDDLSALRLHLRELGVGISNEWNSGCTHLTMPAITLTMKVVLALVYLKPIVTPAFWAESARCRAENLPLPRAESFLPTLKEATINRQAKFHVEAERATLFREKNFIFFSRNQHNNYKDIIGAAGGESCYLGDCRMTNAQLCAAHSVVVQYSPHRSSQDSQETQVRIEEIAKYVTSRKSRFIPDTEIGLAVLYVSTERYCNPRFSFATIFAKPESTSTTSRILAPETQEEACSSQLNLTIMETSRTHDTLPSSIASTTANENSEFLDSSIIKCDKSRNKIKAPSPVPEEPPSKRKNLGKLSKKSPASESKDETLFEFIEETPHPRLNSPQIDSTKSSDIRLKIQSSKRKRENSFCKEDLFNFIPDESEKTKDKSRRTFLSSPLKKSCEDSAGGTLKLSNKKNKVDTSDDVHRSLNDQQGCVPLELSPDIDIKPKYSISNSHWLSKKNCSSSVTTIKKEDPDSSSTSYAEEKLMSLLKELNLHPAVVEINNDLIVTREHQDTAESSVSVGRNFKKFSKVKPVRARGAVLPPNLLVVYEPESKSSVLEKFAGLSSDEDEKDDHFATFTSMGKQKPSNRGRRRM